MIANGDARKAINLLYFEKLKTRAPRQRHEDSEEQEKEELKVNIFHTLGKFLYAKRKNIDFDPNKKEGPKNLVSRYYN